MWWPSLALGRHVVTIPSLRTISRAQNWTKETPEKGGKLGKKVRIWKPAVKIHRFCIFSDLLDVYYDTNEHIDMNPIISCQASSDTSLEYQQGVDWLQMARTASKMAQKGQKISQNGRFSKIHVCGLGTLNLSQEMSDKMQNESTRGRLAWNSPYSLKNGPKRPKNGPKWGYTGHLKPINPLLIL